MKRRTYLGTTAGVVGALAGCTGGASESSTDETVDETPTGDVSPAGSAPYEHPGTMDTTFVANGDYPEDAGPSDGYPPEFADAPPSPDADPDSFSLSDYGEGETVRLAPIDVVEAWYRRGEARFVDARGPSQYQRAHVYGAVLSSAQRDSEGGGIEGWAYDDRIVTYCACPHHLSSIRTAGLQKAGFENVYAFDEGFTEWSNRGNPMAGTRFASDTQASVSEWEITGSVDSDYAGEYVWARADRQYEAAPVREDGSYRLHLKFVGVSETTPIEVSTPMTTVERPLGAVGSRL